MDPFTAYALSAAVSTGISYIGGKKAEKKAKENAANDREVLRQQAEIQVDALNEAKDDATDVARQKMSDFSRQAAIERARIITAAGEAGVAGASVSDQLLANFQHEAESRGRTLYNLREQKEQYNRDITAVHAGLQVNMPRAQTTAPSAGAVLAGLAGELTSAYLTSGVGDK